MAPIRRLLFRLVSFFRAGRAEAELAREINSHLQLLEDELLASGLSAEEARFAARRAMALAVLAAVIAPRGGPARDRSRRGSRGGGPARKLSEGELMRGNGAVLLPVVSVLMMTVGLAAVEPAQRGLRVQPTEALREQ